MGNKQNKIILKEEKDEKEEKEEEKNKEKIELELKEVKDEKNEENEENKENKENKGEKESNNKIEEKPKEEIDKELRKEIEEKDESETKDETLEEIEDNQEIEQRDCLIIKRGKKTFINLLCCELNIGLAFTYLYLLSSSGISIINRILFHNYIFNYNFIYSFLGQFVTLLLFLIFGRTEFVKNNIGNINFRDFLRFKYYYISFTTSSIISTLIGFYGNQLIKNVSMFLTLKKFTLIILLIIDLFFSKKNKKRISWITLVCIFLMVGGSLLVGIDTFSDDYVGYILVFVSDIISVVYSKLIESFRDFTGVSSLKLLFYNNILSIPILLIGALINGEYQKIYIYFVGFGFGEDNTLFGLIFFIFLSCVFSAILLSSLFISTEKISSLMTSLLNNTKMVFISVFMYFFDSSKNKLNILILLGLIMSTFGAVFINAESLFKNLSFKKKDKKEDISSEKKNEKTELIDINNESQENTKEN